MNVLDLFSGIGAFSLGLERAGMQTVAFCEIDPFCRKVLKKHWPQAPCYEDIKALSADRLRADGVVVDVICGGFPCQDISLAGKGAGLDGSRSGLWTEYARIIGELRPRYVIVENVAALLGRGLGKILGDLAALRYDAEWNCIPAIAVGAPHIRDRVWIVAYPDSFGWGQGLDHLSARQSLIAGSSAALPDTIGDGLRLEQGRRRRPGRNGSAVAGDDGATQHLAHAARSSRPLPAPLGPHLSEPGRRGGDFSHTECVGRQGRSANAGSARSGQGKSKAAQERRSSGNGAAARHTLGVTSSTRLQIGPRTLREWAYAATAGAGWWATEPDVGRVADGPAARLDRRKRLEALGNSNIPDIAEILGRGILAFEAAKEEAA